MISVGILILNSCAYDQVQPEIDCSNANLVADVIEIVNVDCGQSNGSFTISVSGGESPYSFLSSLGTNDTGIFTNVSAGTYEAEITDAIGCIVQNGRTRPLIELAFEKKQSLFKKLMY